MHKVVVNVVCKFTLIKRHNKDLMSFQLIPDEERSRLFEKEGGVLLDSEGVYRILTPFRIRRYHSQSTLTTIEPTPSLTLYCRFHYPRPLL